LPALRVLKIDMFSLDGIQWPACTAFGPFAVRQPLNQSGELWSGTVAATGHSAMGLNFEKCVC